MSVTSLVYLACALLAAVIFRRLPQKWRNLWLLVVSTAYIATWSWQFSLVLLAFGALNFWMALRVETSQTRKKALTAVGIAINLLVLFLFKYHDFYIPALQGLLKKFGIAQISDGLHILVPVGLSFLVVQAISYLLDVSNDRLKAERDLVKFWVYVVYFPKLLSGPVERAGVFLARLEKPLSFNRVLLERSVSLILTGLFRKLVLADALFRMIPEGAFVTPQNFDGQHLVFWLLGYAFALVNDFAGYTAIVRGVSLWFGIELNINFKLPYFSHNFTEFWTRWHISLSSWLQDYIYFPLSWTLTRRFAKRGKFIALVVPPLVTMLVSALWHGLSWNMLAWGGLHALYLVGERLLGLIKRPIPLSKQTRFQRAMGMLITFLLATIAWLPFRLTLPIAWEYFTGMFKWVMPDSNLIIAYFKGTTSILAWSPLNLPNPLVLLVLALALGFDLLMRRENEERELYSCSGKQQVLLLVVMFLLILASLFTDSVAPFVYQAF